MSIVACYWSLENKRTQQFPIHKRRATSSERQTRQRPLADFFSILLVLGASLSLHGCLSPIAMHQAVLEYDRTVNRVEAELLLLNIARARHFHPVHFTAVSSVAATFDFRVNAGILGRIGSSPDDAPVDVEFGTSVAENPTVTIIPIAGEEFTKRILRPLDESQFEFLAHQGFDINMILRLMARGIAVDGDENPVIYFNDPSCKEEYAEFRRRLLHLSSLQYARKLHITPIKFFEEAFPVALDRSLTPTEIVAALDKAYRWTMPAKGQPPILTRRIAGRLAITNYSLKELTNEERRQLNDDIDQFPRDYVFVDIRPGYPGGDYPLRGKILLRSFNAIIGFVAKGIADQPEYFVEKDPRSGPVMHNPARTLEIEESTQSPNDSEFSVELEGQHYWIRKFPISEGMVPSWNQEAFAVLANLYQMTVTDISGTKAPIISIPKG